MWESSAIVSKADSKHASPMIEGGEAVLLVIDFQEKLLPKIFNAGAIVPQAVKLIRFAQALQVPVLATEQYPRGLGPTVNEIAGELAGAAPLVKTAFGCFGDSGFVVTLRAAQRKQLVIVGIETHVCVMQTVLGALDAGYGVFVVRDAVGSRRETDYEAALARMTNAGVEIVTAEMAMFEILRDASRPEFKRVLPLLK